MMDELEASSLDRWFRSFVGALEARSHTSAGRGAGDGTLLTFRPRVRERAAQPAW